MTDIPEDAIAFTIRLDPDDEVLSDFDGWIADERKQLEQAGLVVTGVQGATFSGYYLPNQVAASVVARLLS